MNPDQILPDISNLSPVSDLHPSITPFRVSTINSNQSQVQFDDDDDNDDDISYSPSFYHNRDHQRLRNFRNNSFSMSDNIDLFNNFRISEANTSPIEDDDDDNLLTTDILNTNTSIINASDTFFQESIRGREDLDSFPHIVSPSPPPYQMSPPPPIPSPLDTDSPEPSFISFARQQQEYASDGILDEDILSPPSFYYNSDIESEVDDFDHRYFMNNNNDNHNILNDRNPFRGFSMYSTSPHHYYYNHHHNNPYSHDGPSSSNSSSTTIASNGSNFSNISNASSTTIVSSSSFEGENGVVAAAAAAAIAARNITTNPVFANNASSTLRSLRVSDFSLQNQDEITSLLNKTAALDRKLTNQLESLREMNKCSADLEKEADDVLNQMRNFNIRVDGVPK